MGYQNRIIGHGTKKASQFQAHPNNWRKHPMNQRSAVKGSLESLGWVAEVIENVTTGRLIDGHERVWNALQNGDADVPFIQVELTEAEEAQALLSLDAIAALAETDREQVNALLEQVNTDNADVMQFLTDFAKDSGLEWGQPEQGDAEPQIDRAAELLEKWKVETGDLWQIGEHRLLCGDSTKLEDVERVMGGEKARLCFTSPPYASQREYKIGEFDWLQLMTGVSEQVIFACVENASIVVNLGLVHIDGKVFRYWDPWISWMEENGQPLYGWYVWDKLSGLMGDWHGRLAPAHEFLFHFANKPNRANKTAETKYSENGVTHYKKDKVGLRKKDGEMTGFTSAGEKVNSTKVIDSVIRCQPQRGGIDGHPAPFSVVFAETLVEIYADIQEIVYEPFAGSGTTMVACQNLNRKCSAIEISPAYCSVILERMTTAFPGIEIQKVNSIE